TAPQGGLRNRGPYADKHNTSSTDIRPALQQAGRISSCHETATYFPSGHINMPFQIHNGLTFQKHTISIQGAIEYPTACRSLVSHQLRFTQDRRPIGQQGAVSRTRHRVLINAMTWGEKAADNIKSPRPFCGHNTAVQSASEQSTSIHLQLANLLLGLKNSQMGKVIAP